MSPDMVGAQTGVDGFFGADPLTVSPIEWTSLSGWLQATYQADCHAGSSFAYKDKAEIASMSRSQHTDVNCEVK
jgi:hypothetical protein